MGRTFLCLGVLFVCACGDDSAGSFDAPIPDARADGRPDARPDAAAACLADPRLGQSCDVGVGACARTGTWVCNAAMTVIECDAEPGPTAPETCADLGVDNDCDDDDTDVDGLDVDCTTGMMGACAAGRTACQGTAMTCVALRMPADETCSNVGSDDDCDGNLNDLEDAEASQLLLSEIMTRPPGAEGIEIYNPTLAAIDLESYGLADFDTYYNAPAGPYPTRSTGSDFIVAFPVGSTIAPCERLTVSVTSAFEFLGLHGVLPDVEILTAGQVGTTQDNTLVPNMLATLAAAVPTTRGLTDDGEMVMLFRMDATRVTDVDYVTWGTTASVRVDKTGVPGFYPDTPIDMQESLTPPTGTSTMHRCTPGETGELADYGNGVGGHDETSELLTLSWKTALVATPGAAEASCTVTDCSALAATIGTACTSSYGVCEDAGVLACGPTGANLRCDGTPLPAGSETCSNVGTDDDCDGDVNDVTGLGDSCGAGCAENVCNGSSLQCVYPRDHLVITEVVTSPAANEAVEILNPTNSAIDLTNYALADFPAYYTLAGSIPSDFIARFPAGASIGPCQRIVVSTYGSYAGQAADYEILSTAEAGQPSFDLPGVPNMLDVDIGSDPGLTDSSEMVMLFRIDAGGAHKDVDYVTWGSNLLERVDKTGVTGFQPDTDEAAQGTAGTAHAVGESFHRCENDEDAETQTGGNGLTGHDETSERWDTTWHKAPARTLGADDPSCP